MHIIGELRQDIQQAMTHFCQSRQLTVERRQNIADINDILNKKNPIKLRKKLIDYTHQLSRGLLSYLPFLEVNQLQYALLRVLSLPKYQETKYLKTLLLEIQYGQLLAPDQGDNAVLLRLSKLEKALQDQSSTLQNLQEEIMRLGKENDSLLSVISSLSSENNELKGEKEKVLEMNKALETKAQSVEEKYEALAQENQDLNEKLIRYQENRIELTKLAKDEWKGLSLRSVLGGSSCSKVSLFSRKENKKDEENDMDVGRKSLPIRV